jgi:putative glutamine amidotransferase
VTEHPGFVGVAHADDGLLEAMETPGDRFRLAVQWHPETGTDLLLFEAFAAACATWRDGRPIRR